MSLSEKIQELFDTPGRTQLMNQEIELCALKYIKCGSLYLVHSYFEKQNGKGKNPLFAAPAIIHEIKRSGDSVSLTLKTLKDEFDAEAVQLLHQASAGEIEAVFSHIKPEYLGPKLKKADWDNWALGYDLPQEQKIAKRKARTREVSANLYRNFKSSDFENKSILFTGCGEGDEIKTLLDYYLIKHARITAFDQSTASIEHCKKLSESYPAIDWTIETLDFDHIEKLQNKKFDFLIAVGVFDRETLDFDYGAELLIRLKKSLQFEALLTKSYSFDLFTKDQYEMLGYEVIKSSNPQTLYTYDNSFFYYLKKSANSARPVRDTIAETSLKFYS